MAADHLAGATVDTLAERYGIGHRTVREKLAKTLAELRASLRICDKTLRRRLVEAGVTIRPRGRRAGAT
jgi:hypothetical protein